VCVCVRARLRERAFVRACLRLLCVWYRCSKFEESPIQGLEFMVLESIVKTEGLSFRLCNGGFRVQG
jgi:hypothetical protein